MLFSGVVRDDILSRAIELNRALVGCDIWGRRISFNLTLLIIGVFALAAGGSPNYIALSAFAAGKQSMNYISILDDNFL